MNEKFTFFWKNRTPFSQWYPSTFELDGCLFTRAEQAMMYKKAVLFGDDESAAQILATDDPAEHQKRGREVKGFDQTIWDMHKTKIVYDINYAKFSQSETLKEKLFQTKGTLLVETNPDDIIWGIGLDEHHPDAAIRQKWRGQNLLGYILTNIRERLLKER